MCETEIKVRQHGGYTVLAVVLALLGIALVGINKVCLDKMNRYHAIARGDIYSEVMRACPQIPALYNTTLLLTRCDACACAEGEPVREDETTEMVRPGSRLPCRPLRAPYVAGLSRSLRRLPSSSSSSSRSSPSLPWCVGQLLAALLSAC